MGQQTETKGKIMQQDAEFLLDIFGMFLPKVYLLWVDQPGHN